MARGGIGRLMLFGVVLGLVALVLAVWLVKVLVKLLVYLVVVAALVAGAVWLSRRVRAAFDRNDRPRLPRG